MNKPTAKMKSLFGKNGNGKLINQPGFISLNFSFIDSSVCSSIYYVVWTE